LIAAAAAIVVCAASVAPAAEQLSLEAIFDSDRLVSPNPSWIRWLPDGTGFLFRLDDPESESEILWREDVDGERARLCDWSAMIEELEAERPDWSPPTMGDVNSASSARRRPTVAPDGSALVGVAAGELFRLDLGSGDAVLLTSADGQELFPTFDPSGTRVAFVRERDLYWIDLESGAEHRLTSSGSSAEILNGIAPWVYEEELRVERSFWWSPDGTRIAYVRYDVGDVPIYPITDQIPRYATVAEQRHPKPGMPNPVARLHVTTVDGHAEWSFDPSAEPGYLARAGWTPDGRAWYLWLDRPQEHLELGIVDLAAGRSTTMLTERDATWINLRDDLTWLEDGSLVWSSERDGWRHLYLYGSDGALKHRLTRGQWQVEQVAGVHDGQVVLVATKADPRERHIYSVSLDGGAVQRVSSGHGTWRIDMAPDGGHWIGTYSDLTTPPRVTLHTVGGSRERVLFDGDIPALADYELATPELGTIQADDGTTLFTAMLRPPDFDPGRTYPVIHYVYGGPHVQLVTRRWGGSRHLFYQLLAQRGYIVFWLDNRGTWGRGKAFESTIDHRLGQLEVTDQLAGTTYLRSLPYVDPDRIAAYGGSYGGYLTLMLLLTAPDTYAAGIAYAPVTDWRLYDSTYTERYMGTPEENPEGYTAGAPLTHASNLASDLLLVHGTMDNNVHLQNTLRLVEALADEALPFELMVYPRVRHGVRISQFKLHFHRLKLTFLTRALWPVSEPGDPDGQDQLTPPSDP
jgi:dipeptidyl-peptidase-4